MKSKSGSNSTRPLERQHEFQELLAAAEALPKPTSDPFGPWRELQGTGVLLSAPHEVEHVRDGERKWAEPGTGPLAFAVARLHGTAAICTAGTQGGDPNWDIGSQYLERALVMAADVKVVLDLHMMLPRGVDIGIGVGPIPALVERFCDPLFLEADSAGLIATRNFPYRAEGVAVTSQLQRRGVPAIQLELSVDCFDPRRQAMRASWTAISRAVARMLTIA
jgi:hypothetical protein